MVRSFARMVFSQAVLLFLASALYCASVLALAALASWQAESFTSRVSIRDCWIFHAPPKDRSATITNGAKRIKRLNCINHLESKSCSLTKAHLALRGKRSKAPSAGEDTKRIKFK